MYFYQCYKLAVTSRSLLHQCTYLVMEVTDCQPEVNCYCVLQVSVQSYWKLFSM